MKKLMHILFFLIVAANVAAQESYVIDSVCAGADRYYRIDTKERGSTWEWHIKDTIGNEIANPAYTDFFIESSPGDTIWGSEINYTWNDIGVFHITTLHFSEHGCDTLEQGIVNVYEAPGAIAGDDMIICADATVTLSTDTAWAYSSMVWTTTGDGTFSNETAIHPTYLPGTADIISGTVTLILTANGMAINVTCDPAVDSMKIRFSNPVIALSKFDLLCYNDSSGWISAKVSGGIEPYIYNWTGPGTFTSAGDSIYGLAAGKYLVLVTDSIGCTVTDSIEITEPLELLASVTADTTEMCDDGIINLSAVSTGGTGSYTHLWTGDGAVFLDKTDTLTAFFQGAIAGFYTLIYNVTDENGCVAADTVEITVLPKDTIVVDTVICGLDAPFEWFGQIYYVTGQYTDTLESLIACDTILMLDLTVLPIDTLKIDTVICDNETPLAVNGVDYFITGIYTDTIVSLTGCDSILVLDLTVLPRDTISFDTTICGLDAPFAWYGEDYFTTGIYIDTLFSPFGCDTTLILDLTVLPIDTLKIDTVICGNEVPLALNGIDYFITGVYTDTIISATGCDSILIVDLTVLPIDTITIDTTICGLDAPLAWLGDDLFVSDVYIDTLVASTGCDSIVILNLTVLPIDTLKIDTVICDNETPLAVNGVDYFITGIYTDTIVSLTGCDSILVLDLTVLPRDTITLDTTICGLDAPFAWYGEDYFTTDIYTDTLISPFGCDTILILDLTVLPIDTLTDIRLVCANYLPYTWNGKDYFETNIYIDTLVSATGCDSILVLDLTVLPIDTLYFSETICGLDAPHKWYGNEFYNSGTYIDTLIPMGSGCDTILILDLVVLPIDTVTVDTIICITDAPFAVNGKEYFNTGIYTDTIVAAIGCDSILIVDLTVMPIDTIKIDTVMCANETPLTLYGKDYFGTNIYTDTLPALIGCDTIVMIDLTVLPIDTVTIDTTICGLDAPYVWRGLDFHTSGIFIDTLSPAVGCDTILILDLTILPIDTLFIDTTLCANELPYAFNGKNYYDANIYIDTIWSATGCDSIFVLDLKVLPVDTVTFDTIVCGLDAPFAWNGEDFFTTGIYMDTLVASTGCDSILILDLTVLPIDTLNIDTTICDNETPFAVNGAEYFVTGIYLDTIVSLTGCDSILVLDLTVLPTDTITLDTTICGLDAPLAWYGKDYFVTGIYIDTLFSPYGCDTTLILDLTVLPVDTLSIDTVICANEAPFAWNGVNYYDTDIYTDTIWSATGCDSIFVLDLTILPVDTMRFDTVICGIEAPYAWNGDEYFVSGIYTDTLPASNGCDSILILDLTVLPIDTLSLDTTICADMAPFTWNGTGYSATGIYIDTLISATGCDSILILDLTIMPLDTILIQQVICENEAPISYRGKYYWETGIYKDSIPAPFGCDTTIIVDLTVLPLDTTLIDTSLCENSPVFAWNSHMISTVRDSSYVEILNNISGCDSLITLNVKIIPATMSVSDTILAQGSPVFTWNSQIIQTEHDSIYQHLLTNAAGCDSILKLNVTVIPITTTVTDTTICEDSPPFVWNGQNIVTDRDSSYVVTYTNILGLDSTLILNVNVIPQMPPVAIDSMLCVGTASFTWNGQTIFTDRDSVYQATLTSSGGCDSIVTLNIKILPTSVTVIDSIVVQGSPVFVWNGQTIQTDNDSIYQVVLTNAAGCDSTVTIKITVIPITTTVTDTTICEDSPPFVWNGQNIVTDRDSSYVVTYKDISGMDSTLILNVNVIPLMPPVAIDSMLCVGTASFTWNGQTIFTDRDSVYQATLTSSGGCDSIVTLNIKILPTSVTVIDSIVVQGSPVFVWNGQTIQTDNDSIYQVVLTNAAGCDSTVILNVDVIPQPGIVTDTIAICIQDVPVVWNGKEYKTDGLYSDTLTTAAGADSIVQLRLILIPEIKPTFDQLGPYCQNVIPDALPTVSAEGITGSWSQTTINTSEIGYQLITFTPDYGQCATSVNMEIQITTNITPAFASIGPFCENSVAPPLPTVSLNNVTGTWSPSSINTQLVMNRTYRFTPDPGQCSPTVEIDIEILPLVIPTFTSMGTLCQNSIAPALPSVSNNGITGTWNPAVIDTKVSGTFTYLFTPVGANCAVPVTMTILVSPEITPAFVQIGPLCQNTVPPALPSVSTNGINGTWNPAIIDTKVAGLATYTFTPLSGQCAVPTSMVIEITPEITPVFAALGPFCQNSVAPALPLVSENGISGKWSPAVINTSVIGFANYTFTPDPGQCAVATTISIEITDQIKPVFAAIGPYCQYSIAPALPLVSQNGITGSWLPDTILTTNAGTISLKFIPDVGQCAAEITVNVVILPEVTPVFVQLGPLCQNTIAPALPAISSNGITGSWSPAAIDTKFDGKFDYLFTPDAGYCAVPVTMTIVITPEVKPLFKQIGPLCQYSPAPALPVVSLNGVQGTWSPSVIDTKTDGLFTFIFTPAVGECAIPDTMTIEITPEITPEFEQLGPLCQNSVAPILPAVSINGITGTWSPSVIDTKAEGTFTFTFTPAPVYCAIPVTMKIVITEEITPVFDAFDPICPFSVAPLLPVVSTNGIKGKWDPAVIDTDKQGIFTFTFTPDSGICAAKTTVKIEISDIIPPVAISRNITVYLDADGKASVTTAQINNGSNDNCELDTLYLSRYDFDCDDVGKNPVTLTAIDAVGLVGTDEAIVTVLDTISPVVICRGPFEIQLDENAEYKLTVAEVLESVDDNCKKIDTMYVFPHELDCDHIGLTIITLMVTDANGNSSYCQTEVMIYGNRPPTVMDDSARTIENVPVVIDIIENDYDEKTSIDISTLAVSIKPRYGTVSVNPVNGDVTYTPNKNFSGVDVLQYRICDDGIPCEPECGTAFVYIVVEPVNDKPLAVDDYYIAGCFSVVRNVLDNDSDPDGTDKLYINTTPLVAPNHGELIIDPDGTVSYFPNESYIGIDSFQYVICDDGIPTLCDSAWVYIEVDCSEETKDPLDCELFIPEGFSPNQDGIHDFFRIMCIHNYPDAKLMIFNRNGDLLWQKENYGNYDVWGDQYNAWWWGTSVLSKFDVGRQMINGEPKLKVGNYIYVLQLGNGEVKNGTVMISY